MQETDKDSPQIQRKIGGWWCALLVLLLAGGLLYVLVAPRSNRDAPTSDRTPLGAAAIAFIQTALRASADSPAFSPLALIAAFLLGGLHALTPGHNKTLTGAFLVGAGGWLRHAVLIGAATAFSHTARVTVMGVLAVTTAGQIASTQYLRWIGLASGALTVFLGAWLLRRHVRSSRSHLHPHDHGHDHGDSHDHHSHDHPSPDRVTLGGLIALGLSHGIVPTFDALAVLLVALSVSQMILGVGLVLAYSLGIAGVLIAVGVLFIRTQTVLLDHPRFGKISRLAPAVAAIVVILLGLSLMVRTLLSLAAT